MAAETDKGTVAMSWRVKLHAVKQLGRQRAVSNFGNARAVQTLMAKAWTRRNTRFQEGKDGAVGFTLSDSDLDFDDLDSIKELWELKQYGRVAEEIEELGVMMEQIRREGGSLKGLVNHYVFTGAPGTGKTSVARLIAQVLFLYGVIATKDTVETSAPNLIGIYVGHTCIAVQKR